MTEELRFKYLEALRQAAWARFEGRRAFEWKVSLGLWGAALAFAATMLTQKIIVSGPGRLTVGLVALTAVVFHGCFLHGTGGRHRSDRQIERFYRDRMAKEVGVVPGDDIEFKYPKYLWTYSLYFQLGVTVVVMVLSWFVSFR